MYSTFWGDGGSWRTVHFPGQPQHGGLLFGTRSLPVTHSVYACIRPHRSSSLELLTHNLLLAPAGIC